MTVSTLGMTPARRRIFDAGNAVIIARKAEADALDARARAQAADDRAAAADRREAEQAKFLEGIFGLVEAASKVARPRAIIKAVAEAHGLMPRDLTGQCRSGRFVRARQEAMWRIKHATGLSLPAIGRHFDGRDHTTVLHGVRVHQNRVDEAVLVITLTAALREKGFS